MTEAEVRKMQSKIIVAYRAGDMKKVTKLQKTLVHSFAARANAVRKVTTNAGAKTPGVDGKILTTNTEKMETIESLKLKGSIKD